MRAAARAGPQRGRGWRACTARLLRVLSPVIIYVLLGLVTVMVATKVGGQADNSYFEPIMKIARGILGTADDPVAAMSMTVRFSVLFLLTLAFITAFQGGYLLLGFEGAVIIALVLIVIITHAVSGAGPVSTGYWFIGATIAGLVILALCALLIWAFYRFQLDDVTPGIVLNILAVPIAALLLSATGLLQADVQSVASVAAPGAATMAGPAAQHGVSVAGILICVAMTAITAFYLAQTRAGLMARAVGSNRLAAEIAGVRLFRAAAALAAIITLTVVAAASAHYFSTGRIQVDVVRDQVFDVLTAALIARMSFQGLPFGVLSVLGLSEFKLYLQYYEFAPETVLMFQGFVLLCFAFGAPLRARDSND